MMIVDEQSRLAMAGARAIRDAFGRARCPICAAAPIRRAPDELSIYCEACGYEAGHKVKNLTRMYASRRNCTCSQCAAIGVMARHSGGQPPMCFRCLAKWHRDGCPPLRSLHGLIREDTNLDLPFKPWTPPNRKTP